MHGSQKFCLDYMTTGKKAAPKVWDTNSRLGEKTAFAETRTRKDRFRRQTPIAAIAIEACHAGSTNTVTEEGGESICFSVFGREFVDGAAIINDRRVAVRNHSGIKTKSVALPLIGCL